MSEFKSQYYSANEEGYLSDGSWCSDFDDSTESSDIWNLPSFKDYSQEIKDNQINENLEATYENTQPPNIETEVSPQFVSAATSTANNEIRTKNLGAIPKTAFSYLNSELTVNIESKFINRARDSTKYKKHLKERGSSEKPSLPLKQYYSNNDQKLTSDAISHSKSNKEELQDDQKSISTIFSQKSPKKLKPEAFSFLNRVLENQSSQETTHKILEEHKKNVSLTAFVVEEDLKSSHASQKYPEDDKYDCIEPVPAVTLLSNFRNNTDHTIDNTSPSSTGRNVAKNVTTLEKHNRETIKPPLPARPPPISKYPLGTFSQQLSGTSTNNAKSIHQNSILPISPMETAIHINSDTSKCPTGIGRDVRLEKTIKKVEEIHASTANGLQNISKHIDVPTEKGRNAKMAENGNVTDECKNARKATTVVDFTLTNLINLDILTRPLPPVPTVRESKVRNSTVNEASEINKNENIKCESETNTPQTDFSTEFLNPHPSSDSTSEDKVSINRNLNSGNQILQKRGPEIKTKPRQWLDIIGQQTHVSTETFHAQDKISAAITARLQNESSMSPFNDSYEKPIDEIAFPNFSEQQSRKRSLDLNMVSAKPDIPPREKKSPIGKENSAARKFSDIDKLQNVMTRPCLPQKLKTTQRSVSCTSLVQTFKDMSFSIWNHNDKRNSEGQRSYESTPRNFSKENIVLEKAKVQEIPIVPSNDIETLRKVITTQEQKPVMKPFAEKHMISRYAWYHHVSAKEAQLRLLALGQDGTFLIRPSTNPTAQIQYTACVVYSGRVLNLHIRKKANGQYALGKEKNREQTFASLSDLIKYHQDIPIEIRPANISPTSDQGLIYVTLRVTPPK